MTPNNTFLRMVETWVPSADGSMLTFGGGWFGSATHFAAVTRRLCFARGEGLPGRAWEQGAPVVLKNLESPNFLRAAAARAEGLACGIAVPLFNEGVCTAVVVLFCGDASTHAGAIEVWRSPSEEAPPQFVDGYYGAGNAGWVAAARSPVPGVLSGLAGMVWQARAPVFQPDAAKGLGALRAVGGGSHGIVRGFALPCPMPDGSTYALNFLSAATTPMAQGLQIWHAGSAAARCSLAFREQDGLMALPRHSAIAADALATGRPVMDDQAIAIPVAPPGRAASALLLQFA